MALTKVQNTGIADDAVTTDKIENSTVIAADIAPGTITNAKLSNSSITINSSATSLGGSATIKHIDWQAVTVADGSTTLTAQAGKGYFLDTNTGVIEVFLPSSPTRGDTIVLADYGGTFATNKCIINTGGQLIDSTTGNDFKVTTNNAVVELVYVDANKGWLVKLNQAAGTTPDAIVTGDYDVQHIEATGGTITTSGDYKIHSFTGDGCFVVSQVSGSAPLNEVSYLVVAGGGGSGGGGGGGGGGAGGFRESKAGVDSYTSSPLEGSANITVTATTFPITVGGGGSAGPGPATAATSGSNSVFSTITSAGGAGGGSGGQCGASIPAGGSGGGGRANQGNSGSAGNTPPVSPPQGSNGGSGGPANGGGGGGGATAVGGNASSRDGGDGGAGATTHITGSPVVYSGGGGGGTDQGGPTPGSPGTAGDGGSGGGGRGGNKQGEGVPTQGVAGTANTGGGAGGGTNSPALSPNSTAGNSGGKGIVVIRYKFQ